MQPGYTSATLKQPPKGLQFTRKLGRPALPPEFSNVSFPTGYNIAFSENTTGRWQHITRPGDFWVIEPVAPHHNGQSSYMLFDTYLGPPASTSEKKKTCCSACVQGQPCCDSDSDA